MPTELADARRRLRRRLDRREIRLHPFAERARLQGVVEQEHGAPLHGALDNRRLDAARLREQPHAAIVARHQRALCRRQRDEEIAAGVLAVDPERSGETDRNLRHAEKILDISGNDGGIEGIGAEVTEVDAGSRREKRASLLSGLGRVVVLPPSGNFIRSARFSVGHRRAPRSSVSPPLRRSRRPPRRKAKPAFRQTPRSTQV